MVVSSNLMVMLVMFIFLQLMMRVTRKISETLSLCGLTVQHLFRLFWIVPLVVFIKVGNMSSERLQRDGSSGSGLISVGHGRSGAPRVSAHPNLSHLQSFRRRKYLSSSCIIQPKYHGYLCGENKMELIIDEWFNFPGHNLNWARTLSRNVKSFD